MKFVFWQNILSIHQSAFIKKLSQNHDVILIAEKQMDKYREDDGWKIPTVGNAIIIENPDKKKIEDILNNSSEAIHIFSGIDAFPSIYTALKIAVKLKYKIGVQLEVFQSVGLKGSLRKIKYFWLQRKYGKHIDFLLTMSSYGCYEYSRVGFRKEKIFNWAYFTEQPDLKITVQTLTCLPKLIYVGRLDKNKNIMGVLPIIKKHITKIESFTIIGDGVLRNKIAHFQDAKIKYIGVLANELVHSEIEKSDILILPSLYDGWGAVVNEALMVGTKVICSEECGASDLIAESRGIVFSNYKNNFEEQFIKIVNDGSLPNDDRKKIINWSKKNISAETAADYFINIIEYVYNNGKKPLAPWLISKI